MSWEIVGFGCDESLVRALAAELRAKLAAAIALRGRASLAVSGGSTPVSLFKRLSHERLAWEHVVVTLVDERWVDENDADSNAGLVRKHLLQDEARQAGFIGLKTAAPDPYSAIPEVEARLDALEWPLDVAILGMGEDGHTASFFPGAATLSRAMELGTRERVCALTPRSASHDRMTLTLQALLNARNLYLHLTGNCKWQVLQAAMAEELPAILPVSVVLHRADPPVQIYYRSGT